MAAEVFATSRVREMSFGMQALIFFVLTQTLKYFALAGPPQADGLSVRNLTLIALLFTPFIWARIPAALAVTPSVLLRSEARVDIHPGGLVYTFDNVKRPLIVEWPDLARLERRGMGLVIEVRHRANVTEGMPAYQAEFWKARIRQPIRLICTARFHPEAAVAPSLAAARAAGVAVRGFGTSPSGALAPA